MLTNEHLANITGSMAILFGSMIYLPQIIKQFKELKMGLNKENISKGMLIMEVLTGTMWIITGILKGFYPLIINSSFIITCVFCISIMQFHYNNKHNVYVLKKKNKKMNKNEFSNQCNNELNYIM